MFTIVDTKLEQYDWPTVNDLSVNKVPAKYYKAQKVNDVLDITIAADQEYGGALAHCSRPIPTINGAILPFVGFDMDIFIPDAAAYFMRCLEIDHKMSVFDAKGQDVANIVDFSSQIETFNKGNIQIDNQSMTWIDTGLATGQLPTNSWFHWAARYLIDFPNKKFSVLSFNINGTTYEIPTNLQNLNWGHSNWGMAAEPSLQLDVTQPCAFNVRYKNITTTYCEHSF